LVREGSAENITEGRPGQNRMSINKDLGEEKYLSLSFLPQEFSTLLLCS
jgi:hypothetical protein